jgi:hypothetical protein
VHYKGTRNVACGGIIIGNALVFRIEHTLVTISHFHPGQIFAGKAGAYPNGALTGLHSETEAPTLARKY